MTSDLSLAELRLDYTRKRQIAIPIAGAICWAVAGAFGAVLPVCQPREPLASDRKGTAPN